MKDLIQAILREIGADAPAEFPVIPAGVIEVDGEAPVLMDERAADMVIAAFKQRGNDLVIDYEHQTLTGQQAPAAGWIHSLRFDPKAGVIAKTSWTEKAIAYLKNREYRYFSPVFFYQQSDRRVAILSSVALTNVPRINHLQPIIAKLNAQLTQTKEGVTMLEKIRATLKLAATTTEDKVVEAVQQVVAKLAAFESAAPVIACKEVLEALGAKADAKKEDVVQVVASLKTATVIACKEVLEALGAKADAKKEDVLAIVASLKAPLGAAADLSQQVAKLTQELAKMKQEDLAQLALKQGQTTPDELAKWGNALALQNPDQFKLIVLSRPVGSVVPIEGLKIAGDKAGIVTDEVQLSINKQMGIDEETYKKFGPKAA